ncbi:WXG100 family type VII secretion target [Actinoplanes sp. NPDC020271]|uniref:WXG100 family type VII secretion target n=1 Tax=Actinoplanes sp. NPDC020271 TaxID=3363896 RepID=UPI00379A86D5
MTANPLVAGSTGSTTSYTGFGLLEDAADITNGIRNHSWVDPALGGVGAGLDMLSLTVDPLGTLVSWGVAWLMEHVRPLRDALDRLAGNADEVAAHAATWANVAAFTDQARRQYLDRLRTEVADWFGAAGDAYRRHADTHLQVLEGLSTAAQGISYAVEGAGLLVALVRGIVRDLIAQFIGTLAARLPQWLAEEGVTLGLATPVVAGQVATLVATWVNKIQHFVRALLSSLRRLHPMLGKLADTFTRLRARNHDLAVTDPIDPPVTSEFRPDFPRGADFVHSGEGISERAAEAYRRIRNSPQDTPRITANTGIDPRIIEGMRQNLFVQQHDVPLGPNHFERGYFTPDDDIADLWDAAAAGSLDAGQLEAFRSLAAHEYVENRLMDAGLPYRSAHPAAFDADGDPILSPDHPGAHDVAPHEYRPDAPLAHWRLFGIDGSHLRLADDLSNLDEVVATALRGLNR